jgi:hypothetical protein
VIGREKHGNARTGHDDAQPADRPLEPAAFHHRDGMPLPSVRLVLKDRLMAESLAVRHDLRVADLTVVPVP